MKKIIKVLEQEKISFEIGVINHECFYPICDKHLKCNVIKIQAKEGYIPKLVKKFEEYNITLKDKIENKYYSLYIVQDSDIKLLIEHIVNSHILVPAVLLRDFMDNDGRLYYLDGETKELRLGSVKKYNTKEGYYSKFFEEHLSNRYEQKIGEIKKRLKIFITEKPDTIEFKNLYTDIDSLYKMSLFRNPRFIEEVNQQSLTSILIKGGYTTEHIASFFENSNTTLFEKYKIFIVINNTEEGLFLSDNIFSDIIISKGYRSLILPLHPKFAIAIVPNEYYEMRIKQYGESSYMMIKDINILRDINICIADRSIKDKVNVIGRKDDLLNYKTNS